MGQGIHEHLLLAAPAAGISGLSNVRTPMIWSRRAMLNIGLAAAAGTTSPGIALADRGNGPQPGDVLVAVSDPAAVPLRADALASGAAPILAWPMDRAIGLVRKATRRNQVLVLRLAARSGNSAGQLVAFSAICPHAGCLVSDWIARTGHLHCPCHGSEYDPAKGGAVVAGPAPQNLPSLPVAIIDGLIAVDGPFAEPPGGHTTRTM
jgi:rieske iron-sulfur protein